MLIEQATILVVDDVPTNIDVLVNILKDSYTVKAAISGKQALKIASSENPPDLILLDVMMPEMDGYEVCRHLKSNSATCDIPIIFVTAKSDSQDETTGLELGAVDYITKPFNALIVKARVRNHLALYDQQRLLEQLVKQRTLELHATRLQIIQRLARAVEFKDKVTGLHVIRMSHYARCISIALGQTEDEAELILNAAPLHDIGKIGVPDNILLKPDKLSSSERRVMEEHPIIGAQIIGEHKSKLLTTGRTIALTHHEKWDGSGYPNGLKSQEIPLVGQIAAIADVFDALTMIRPYKPALDIDEATDIIRNSSGSHFNPKLVTVFEDSLTEIIKIKESYLE